MTLIFSQLSGQLNTMSQTIAKRRHRQAWLAGQARHALSQFARVTAEMRAKIAQACQADSTWRGAEPVGDRLDECHRPSLPWQPTTLVAADGSQSYPDPAGIALYYLLNVGGIIMRSGSGDTPEIRSQATVYFRDSDLYSETGSLVEMAAISALREQAEIRFLADLVAEIRITDGGDLAVPLAALTDGPLLLWAPQKGSSRISRETEQRIKAFAGELQRLQKARAWPAGYIDRPRSASVLRTLHVVQLSSDQLTAENIRANRYRHLTDREIFTFLQPNERSALFRSVSPLNQAYARLGQEIHFFYLNVASTGSETPYVVRVEVPAWLSGDPAQLDRLQQAIYHSAQEARRYPYVLIRAHEIALVTRPEQAAFEELLAREMMQQGIFLEPSTKGALKALF